MRDGRGAGAVFAVTLVLTCALVSILPDAVRAANFHRHSATKPEARAGFELLLYRYSDFRDEPHPETLSFDTLLVALIDSYAGSAGEDFVKYVRQLDNVVVVGTNTCGAMLAANVGLFTLPNSKIGLSCGTKISLREDLANPNGRGLMPDLWVHPDEALERAIKYIQAVQADGRNH